MLLLVRPVDRRRRWRIVRNAHDSSSTAWSRRQLLLLMLLLRGDRGTLYFRASETRTSTLVIRGRRGSGCTRRHVRIHGRGVETVRISAVTSGIVIIAAAVGTALHQQVVVVGVVVVVVIVVVWRASHRKLITSTVGISTVALTVRNDGRQQWSWRKVRTTRLLLLLLPRGAALMWTNANWATVIIVVVVVVAITTAASSAIVAIVVVIVVLVAVW